MDYTGFSKRNRFKIDRPLTEDERKERLVPHESRHTTPLDWLSVIKINSTYIELVDRWYPIRGYSVWMSMIILMASIYGLGVVLWGAFFCDECSRNNTSGFPVWGIAAIFVPIIVPLVMAGIYGVLFEAFRKTHYPIRLNRKTRMVYVIQPSGKVISIPWDKLFIYVAESNLPMFDKSIDIRAHILENDGKTVKDTFTLAYTFLGNKDGLFQLWEYIRRYMEEPDGIEQSFRITELCLPIDNRREGLRFGVIRSFAQFSRWPVLQLVASPLLSLTVLGRWMAMYTSKVPHWPEEIEAECQVEVNDPYRKDWRSNGRYSFIEGTWPVVCFLVGLVVVGVAITWLMKELF